MRMISALFVALAMCSPGASAQTPALLKVVVPFPAGGSADIVARLWGEDVKNGGGPTVVVENRPGGSAISRH
jgi:tripartite-type tricarboxylate transporter receptor subunit TctC